MKKAAIYARVSTEAQHKEGTIQSQIAELKRQVVGSGDVLVKEYIDDGHSGALMDRPALDVMRKDLKTNLFDVVYFLNTDRIARDVTYQNLIIAEILKYQKQIFINGKDYIHNPENKFKITVLGAVAELERAKIIERSQRGKMHKLKKGLPLNNGYNTLGYDYIPKTDTAPGQFVINAEEAKTIRYIFKTYVDGASWTTIIRALEEKGAVTKTGKKLWDTVKLTNIVKNHTYTGIKYYNTRTLVKDPHSPLRKIKYGKKVYKDRSEWIPVKVPAIIPKSLYDKAQTRLEASRKKYRNPKEYQLLSNLMSCGECGRFFISYQRYYRSYYNGNRTGNIFHKAAYRCSRRNQQRMHSKNSDLLRCKNPEVATHLLESCVFKMVDETMIYPDKLKTCLTRSSKKKDKDQRKFERQLKEVETRVLTLMEQKKKVLDEYATEKISKDEYSEQCVSLDIEINKAKVERTELIRKVPDLHKEDVIDVSVRQFCETVKARLEKCKDFDTKRKFLLDFVDKVIYQNKQVTLHGSIPIRLKSYADPDQTSDASKITFKIEGQIV